MVEREYRVGTKLGTETFFAWDAFERDGILTVITRDGVLALFADGEWLRLELVGTREKFDG